MGFSPIYNFALHSVTITAVVGLQKSMVILPVVAFLLLFVMWFAGLVADRLGYYNAEVNFIRERDDRFNVLMEKIDRIEKKLRIGNDKT